MPPPDGGGPGAESDGRQERASLRHGAPVPAHALPAHAQRALLHAARGAADDPARPRGARHLLSGPVPQVHVVSGRVRARAARRRKASEGAAGLSGRRPARPGTGARVGGSLAAGTTACVQLAPAGSHDRKITSICNGEASHDTVTYVSTRKKTKKLKLIAICFHLQ